MEDNSESMMQLRRKEDGSPQAPNPIDVNSAQANIELEVCLMRNGRSSQRRQLQRYLNNQGRHDLPTYYTLPHICPHRSGLTREFWAPGAPV
jgi:hypothetical protein